MPWIKHHGDWYYYCIYRYHSRSQGRSFLFAGKATTSKKLDA